MSDEIMDALDAGTPYDEGETRISYVAGAYWVEHGIYGGRPPLTCRHTDIEQAIASFKHYRQRRCTSCGQPGCPEDLVGKRSIMDPLPRI